MAKQFEKPPVSAPAPEPAPGLVIPTLKSGGYARQKVELHLNGVQAQKLCDILAGLQAADAKLEDGRPVGDSEQVVKWIIEQVK